MLRESRGAITAFALVVCAMLVAVSVDLGVPGEAILQSLRFHIAAGLLLLVVMLLATGAWWRALLFLLLAGLSLGEGAQIVYGQQQLRGALDRQPHRPLLKLLSFNLLNQNENGAQIADFLAGSDADVVFLMEATPIDSHLAQLAASFPYRVGCDEVATCDTVMLSRTPLEDVAVRSLSSIWTNRLVTATSVIGGERINLVAVHMVKPYFDYFAYEEAYILNQVLAEIEGPLLLAGDLNAAAWSDNIARLAKDAKLIPGPLYPATWPVRFGPLGVPIDNVFTRAPLLIERIESLDDAMGSNHRGLVAEIALAQ